MYSNWGHILWSQDEMVVSSCFIFSFSGLARASMMQSEDRVKCNNKASGGATLLTFWISIFHSLPHTHKRKHNLYAELCVRYRPGHHSWGMWGTSRSPLQERWGCHTTGFETASEAGQKYQLYRTRYLLTSAAKTAKNVYEPV